MWQDFEPDVSYLIGDMQVAFSKDALGLLRKIDPQGKHLRAIEKGHVAPRGQSGLVPSEVQGYTLKTKVLGLGGAVRVHGRYLADGTVCFDLITRH